MINKYGCDGKWLTIYYKGKKIKFFNGGEELSDEGNLKLWLSFPERKIDESLLKLSVCGLVKIEDYGI